MGVDVITVRTFTEADIPAAVALEQANRPHPWTEGVFRDELAAEGRVYLAADDAGLVGFGGVTVSGDEAHVTNLLVAPDHRGSGLGRRLMVGLIEAAREAGARHLTLEVRASNRAARALYASLGLAPVGVRPGYYGDDDALIMWAHDIDSPRYVEKLG